MGGCWKRGALAGVIEAIVGSQEEVKHREHVYVMARRWFSLPGGVRARAK